MPDLWKNHMYIYIYISGSTRESSCKERDFPGTTCMTKSFESFVHAISVSKVMRLMLFHTDLPMLTQQLASRSTTGVSPRTEGRDQLGGHLWQRQDAMFLGASAQRWLWGKGWWWNFPVFSTLIHNNPWVDTLRWNNLKWNLNRKLKPKDILLRDTDNCSYSDIICTVWPVSWCYAKVHSYCNHNR